MKKNFKLVLALVLSIMMVLSCFASAFADGDKVTGDALNANDPKYKITVTNKNPSVSIDGKTYKAYKLFENWYVPTDQTVTGDNAYADPNAATTSYSQDDTPHAYYIKKGSPFFTSNAVELVAKNNPDDGTKKYRLLDNNDNTPIAKILDYFVLTELPGESSKPTDEQLVLVTPKEANGVSTFTATEAYELAQKLNPFLATIDSQDDSQDWMRSALASGQTVVINVEALGAGYYLVTGEGKGYSEEDTSNWESNPASHTANGNDVTAAVALTTTDPTAEIIAKLDATKLEKKIDENKDTGASDHAFDVNDVKYDNHAIGDNVPYVVQADIPNMTGYEKYFFIMNDTLSKGLKLNDSNDISTDNDRNNGYDNGFKVFITLSDNAVENLKRVDNYSAAATLNPADYDPAVQGPVTTGGKNTMTYYVEKDEANNSFQLIFHDFIQYKGQLITEDNYATLNVTRDKIGTYHSKYDGAKITILYSATVTEDALIGTTGNVNSASIEYSNKPDIENNGKPNDNDKPGEGEDFKVVTEISPSSKTVTYVTGLKVLKYTEATGHDKLPLANAEFTFVGQNLMNLVKESKVVYRVAKTNETANIYKLTGGRFTTEAPTFDKVVDASAQDVTSTVTEVPAYGKIVYGTCREYDGFNAENAATKIVKTLHGNVTIITGAGANNIEPQYMEDTLTETSLKKFKEDATNGSWYLLKNGTYTNKVPGSTGAPDNSAYSDTTKKYVEVTEDWDKMTEAEKDALTVRQVLKTDGNGILLLRGLCAGEYTLTETKAPDGYNMLAQPIKIKVEWCGDTQLEVTDDAPSGLDQGNKNVANNDQCSWKIYYKNADQPDASYTQLTTTDTISSLYQLDVMNNTGIELPSTGGIGTTIFYVAGSLMVLAAVILLITKRRMGAED